MKKLMFAIAMLLPCVAMAEDNFLKVSEITNGYEYTVLNEQMFLICQASGTHDLRKGDRFKIKNDGTTIELLRADRQMTTDLVTMIIVNDTCTITD